MSGVERIAAERQRQIEVHGYDPEDDASYFSPMLALAAACYAIPSGRREAYLSGLEMTAHIDLRANLWPFKEEFWHPTPDNRIRELEKAGALIAAEIDRLERLP